MSRPVLFVLVALSACACSSRGSSPSGAPGAKHATGDADGGLGVPDSSGARARDAASRAPDRVSPDAVAPRDAASSGQSEVMPAAPSCTPSLPPDPAHGLVLTTAGLVHGVADGTGWVFRGIRYAAPPVGDLRFRPPQPPECSEDIVDAHSFAPPCAQIDAKGHFLGEEDCLALNVWTPGPIEFAQPGRPVLVFVHGGGNIQGSASQTLQGGKLLYDGRRLADVTGAVVVTIDYRLGPFGFLALPEMADDSGQVGNFGILDQVAALRWVHDNIEAFGGDPTRVLLFGESAGAVDTCVHLASPLSAGLFSAAIIESGGCNVPPVDVVAAAHAARVAATPCGQADDRLECLRALSPQALLSALPGDFGSTFKTALGTDYERYQPVVDGHVLHDSPLAVILAGQHNRVPFVVGANAEELEGQPGFDVATAEEFAARIQAAFGVLGSNVVDAIETAYPVGDYPSPHAALVAVFSDMRFVCPSRRIARAVAASQTEPVYRYFFARRPPTKLGSKPAAHGMELLYVFGSLANIPLYQPPPEDVALSEAIMRYWSRLAASGDPNGEPDPAWPAYDGSDPYLRLDVPIEAGAALRAPQCDMWDDLFAALGGLVPPAP